MEEIFANVIDLSNFIQAVFGLFSVYVVYAFLRDRMFVIVDLGIGTFRIKRKYYDVQNVTNIVSANFYIGGQVPADVRREIIELMFPKVKMLNVKK